MTVVYLGTPEFAVPSLEALLDAGHEILEVITQPDRPKGRNKALAASPVKLAAQAHNIPVYQPERIRRPESVEHLRALKPDVMVVVGYGQIIPQSIIDISPRGIINVHGSLLPKLRGAAPIQWSIVNGDRIAGVTTMQIDAGLDTGAMLLKAQTEIGPEEDAVELGARLSTIGAALLIETLATNPRPEPQNSAQATLAPILTKDSGRISWTQPARIIHDLIRGLQPWPGGHTTFRKSLLQIWKATVAGDRHTNAAPGHLLAGPKPLISCGNGTVLELFEVQLEGRKRIPAEAFWNGLRLADNEPLGVPAS